MKKFTVVFLLLCTAALSFYSPNKISHYSGQLQDSVITITLAATGDLMCHSVQYNYAGNGSGGFDFNPFFEEIKEILSAADFTFGNLETVTAGKEKGFSGYPLFNTPDEYLDALKSAGFDLLNTSNNHSLDRGEAGLRRTIEQLINRNVNYNGTYLSQADRDSLRIFDIKGIKAAFLAYTYGTNGNPIPDNVPYLINVIDTLKIKNDVKIAHIKGCDVVLIYFHFGEEYNRIPDSYQRRIVQSAKAAGADIIIGSHPHVIQPLEFFTDTAVVIDTGIIAYSLGNFFSNQRWRYSDAGVILFITLSKNINSGKIKLVKTEFLPTWVYKASGIYRILPAENYNAYDFLNKNESSKMQQAFDDTREILTKYSELPILRNVVNKDSITSPGSEAVKP